MENPYFESLMQDLMSVEEVQALLLSGSRAAGTHDASSDYDVYVYVTGEIPVEKRKAITDRYCSYMELDNRFWETEDDGILQDGTPVELIYRSLDWLDAALHSTLVEHHASTGYTTCLWYNLLQSSILYDRDGRAHRLQQKYHISYPQGLKEQIIRKNYPLLKQKMPAYYQQIEKALQRGDAVSVVHRLAAFLESYFDILFALNEQPHPGEKRLVATVLAVCPRLPEDFEGHLKAVTACVGREDHYILEVLDQVVENLDALLCELGFNEIVSSDSW